MPTPVKRAKRRALETPLELSIAVLAVAVSILTLVYEWDRLSFGWIAAYIVLAVGGVLVTTGRLRDDPDVESAGIALLLATLLFTLIFTLRLSHTLEAVLGVILNYASLMVGFGMRLYVVRTAARTRRRATEKASE